MWSSIESKDPNESGSFQELKEDLHVIQKKGRRGEEDGGGAGERLPGHVSAPLSRGEALCAHTLLWRLWGPVKEQLWARSQETQLW